MVTFNKLIYYIKGNYRKEIMRLQLERKLQATKEIVNSKGNYKIETKTHKELLTGGH